MMRLKRWLAILALLFLVTGCAYSKHMNTGNKAFDEGNYEMALEQFEAALKIDPNSTEAAEKAQASREKLVGQFAEQAQAALAADDILGAIDAAALAWEKLSDGESTKQLIQDVSNATHAKAQTLAQDKDWANSLMLYETIGRALPTEAERARPKADEVKGRWVEELKIGAQEAEAAGRKGDAALQYAKLTQLSGDPTFGGKRDQLRNDVLAQYRYVVKVGGRSSEGLNVVLGGLSGYGQGTALLVAQQPERGVPVAADARLTVARPKFRTDTTTRTETASYQSGTQQVENPFYKSKQDSVLQEEQRLLDKENEVTRLESDVDRYRSDVAKEGDTPNVSTGAEQNLYNAENRLESARRSVEDQRRQVQRAKEDLARESPTKEEPVFSELQYTITTHTLTAETSFEASIKHSDKRPAVEVSVPLSTQATDDAHPAQSVANVPEDPLQLPPKSQLTTELYGRALAEAQGAISKSFDDWRNALIETAMAAGTDDERVDWLAIYIITNPDSVSPKVPADISAFRGIPDPVKILKP